jgi:hypothetical protein
MFVLFRVPITNGLAAVLCPVPMALTDCFWAANDVFVTGVKWPGIGEAAAELSGVTDGFHVAPPLQLCERERDSEFN